MFNKHDRKQSGLN